MAAHRLAEHLMVPWALYLWVAALPSTHRAQRLIHFQMLVWPQLLALLVLEREWAPMLVLSLRKPSS